VGFMQVRHGAIRNRHKHEDRRACRYGAFRSVPLARCQERAQAGLPVATGTQTPRVYGCGLACAAEARRSIDYRDVPAQRKRTMTRLPRATKSRKRYKRFIPFAKFTSECRESSVFSSERPG